MHELFLKPIPHGGVLYSVLICGGGGGGQKGSQVLPQLNVPGFLTSPGKLPTLSEEWMGIGESGGGRKEGELLLVCKINFKKPKY